MFWRASGQVLGSMRSPATDQNEGRVSGRVAKFLLTRSSGLLWTLPVSTGPLSETNMSLWSRDVYLYPKKNQLDFGVCCNFIFHSTMLLLCNHAHQATASLCDFPYPCPWGGKVSGRPRFLFRQSLLLRKQAVYFIFFRSRHFF